MSRIFVASRNAKKIAEMERILAPLIADVEVLGLDDVDFYEEPVEDAPTFEGNALIKARAGFEATGIPSVADDSGLCVDALNGMPGVLSARWGGKPKSDDRNNQLLLDQLDDVPDERRGAHFTCAVAFVHAGGELVVEGRMTGRVLRAPAGEGGFGYDPLFVADDTADGRTSAELSVDEKDAISHRGKAMREIASRIAEAL
ncbi:RdgB/HAM1 family non-canonical purine NTP pyrophosphatase [Nocardioides sp. Kera G14]|uniref:RdgB/HAM1 family non-canonical purine NTP pyrophosphatase n=1 Tax=Nocardioides sp. Kera G14 TaxID=2884264 RepID=UPI001D0FEBE2|nr:RdgB/HAM1 family non-canonical purine NTP pyrophosphatase [Nocardioides sp. Kera G14]UDY22779.1 RdgB/HAM1 family non-canonical purine NTP pyrophosphatase [Nocardioides sp. Kera G14]